MGINKGFVLQNSSERSSERLTGAWILSLRAVHGVGRWQVLQVSGIACAPRMGKRMRRKRCPGEQKVTAAGMEIKSASTGKATRKCIQIKPALPVLRETRGFLSGASDLDQLACFSPRAFELPQKTFASYLPHKQRKKMKPHAQHCASFAIRLHSLIFMIRGILTAVSSWVF